MMNIFQKRFFLLSLLTVILLTAACDDKWDEHYNEAPENLPQYNLFEYISSEPSLSTFAQMMEATGYDSIVGANQTYTVWAPDNEALTDVDMSDEDMVRQIVQNHIARGNFTTSGLKEEFINVLNGKFLPFSRSDGAIHFSGADLDNANILTSNGLVHKMNAYVPYIPNLWEYITEEAENLDSLRTYLEDMDQTVFDAENSTEIGIDSMGNAVYDSVFVYQNLFMEERGQLDVENQPYSMIMLENGAWSDAYERVFPYYNFPEVYGGGQRQVEQTKWAMTQDLVFRGRIEEPGSRDSLVSTNGNKFYNPGQLFDGAQRVELSNGYGYLVNQFNYSDTASWFPEIRIEAENSEGRETSNNDAFVRTGLGTGLDISEDSYLFLESTGTSDFARSSVTFTVPNTLSAKYNIYVVFVSAEGDDRPVRAEFQLTYMATTNGRTRRERISPEVDETNPAEGLTKMFVTQWDFEFANVVDENYTEVQVRLQITNSVRQNELEDYSRDMRIDCVIFEPVVE